MKNNKVPVARGNGYRFPTVKKNGPDDPTKETNPNIPCKVISKIKEDDDVVRILKKTNS